MVHLSPKKLILFGAACSPVTDQIAKAASHWNLVQLTYADTHPMFTNKVFPNFYRVVPSENEFNPPRLSILRYFNWTRVGTLYQNSAKYALVSANYFTTFQIPWFIQPLYFKNLRKGKKKDLRLKLFRNSYQKGLIWYFIARDQFGPSPTTAYMSSFAWWQMFFCNTLHIQRMVGRKSSSKWVKQRALSLVAETTGRCNIQD